MKDELILKNLYQNEDYCRKIYPFIKEEYFFSDSNKFLFNVFSKFFNKHNKLPTKEVLENEIENNTSLNEDLYKELTNKISNIFSDLDENTSIDWLVDSTEQFCQEKAIHNGIMESIQILDGKSSLDKGAIPEILSDALAVSFDTHIGHDYINDAEKRYDFYTKAVDKVPFDIELLNKITNNGFESKTLNVFLASTGVGKTALMTYLASCNLLRGKNVLYITLEMSEEKIAERIDANLLNINLKDLRAIPRETFLKKISLVKQKTSGTLKIKEYPPTSAGAGHFRHLLNELKIKNGFIPDIIYIDYINLCCSMRYKPGTTGNTNTIIKSICEEIRGLGVEKCVPIVSATQLNRGGHGKTDPDMDDTSESWGLTNTVDFLGALVVTEELLELGQVMFIQLKNRYNDVNYYKRFVIGMNRAKMQFFDIDQNEKKDAPVMDDTEFGMKFNTKKSDFGGLKT